MNEIKTDEEAFKATRRKRSVVLGLVLGAVVVIFYIMTIVKMGPAVFDRPL